jgi:deoxyribodipyrimidine photo-lyase
MLKRPAYVSPDSSSKRFRNEADLSRTDLPLAPDGFQINRARLITRHSESVLEGNCVILWMMRDQRVNDNHALQYAQSAAKSKNLPLKVVFNLVPKFLDATLRQYSFMLKGLQEVESSLRSLEIPFHLLLGDPVVNIPRFVDDQKATLLVTDFSPLRVGLTWVNQVGSALDSNNSRKVPFVQVDAHNIVPCWVASPKLEYSARTFRSKVTPLISDYLRFIPSPDKNPSGSLDCEPIDWKTALDSLEINRNVKEVDWITPGESAAAAMVEEFISSRLSIYEKQRNDPTANALSNLSPYFHFGQLSVGKVVMRLKALTQNRSSADNFIEEAVVRRELADNFCYCKCLTSVFVQQQFYSIKLDNSNYDNLNGCYEWAKETLEKHRGDARQFIYTRQQLENAKTHDDLWNAAQIQMVTEGKMHV